MSSGFQAGDFLVFQIESGFGLLRVLAVEKDANGNNIWHLAAYDDLFFEVEFAEMALANPTTLTISKPHLALTNRAFESTQVAKIANQSLQDADLTAFNEWKENPNREISDISIRLHLGLR